MDKIKSLLQGKKTYLVAIASIIGVLIAWSDGSMDTGAAVRDLIGLVITMTIRSGVDTAVNTAVAKQFQFQRDLQLQEKK